MFNPFSTLNIPIFESNFLPKAEKVTRRVEWITRNHDGTFTFRHDLRRSGSIYEVHDKPAMILHIPGMGIVMRPEDATVIRMSSVS